MPDTPVPSSSSSAAPSAPTQAITRHLAIHGRVQGVYYRQSMVDAAAPLAVRGWVRNRSDGSVEALVQGAPHAVQALQDWARRGPAGARVDAVVATDLPAPPDELGAGFVRRPTV